MIGSRSLGRPDLDVGSARVRAAAVSCLLVVASLAGCVDEAPPAAVAPPPVKVTVMQVEAADVPVTSEFVGRTASSRRVEIRSRVAGFLEERVYEEGTLVEEGDVLFRMDAKPFDVQLDAARAELARQVAARDNARALLDRIRPLVEQDAVARKELDDAVGAYEAAEAAVAGARARVSDAELDLSYCEIHAPVTGLSSFALQEEGAYIGGIGDSLLTYVAAIDPIRVEFSASENQGLEYERRVREGLVVLPSSGPNSVEGWEVEIVLADGRTYGQTGRMTFADASIDERTGTLLLRAELPNPHGELRPGQFVRVLLQGAYRPGAITVPQRAVQQGPSGSFVWVVDDEGAAEPRPVVLGPWAGGDWIIEDGLEDGEIVVVAGVVGLRPGAPVAVTRIDDAGDDDDDVTDPARAGADAES